METRPFARCVSAVVTIGVAATPALAQRPNDYHAEGVRLYEAGRYQEAISYFNVSLERKHRDIEGHIKRGNSYLKLNRADLALADYNSVIQFNRFFAPVYIDRGIAYIMLGQLDAAANDFNYALKLYNSPSYTFDPASSAYYDSSWNVPTITEPLNWDPKGTQRALAYSGLGQVYHRSRRDAEAVEQYNASLRLNPNDTNTLAGRGDALLSLGQVDEALACFNQAIQLAPNHSRAFASRGEAFSRIGETDRALSDFDHAIALDPGSTRARRLRASLLSANGQDARALEDLDAILRVDPKDAGTLKDKGGVLVRMGKPGPALEFLAESIRLDPSRASAYVNQGVAQRLLGANDLAILSFDEAIRLDPGHVGAWTDRGLARADLGQLDDAIRDFGEAIRLNPENAIPRVGRAEALARHGRPGDAVPDYETAAQLAPKAPSPLIGLGHALDALGRHEPAIEAYSKALPLVGPNESATLYRDMGNSRRMRRDWSGALADLDKSLELQPRDADAHALRGWTRLIADRDGGDEDARAYLDLRRGHDKSAPYMAILGALASRRAHRGQAAQAFLDEGIANPPSTAWPVPILHALRNATPLERLLEAKLNPGQDSEARAFLTLDRIDSNDKSTSIAALRQVVEHGSGSPVALDLAREALARLER